MYAPRAQARRGARARCDGADARFPRANLHGARRSARPLTSIHPSTHTDPLSHTHTRRTQHGRASRRRRQWHWCKWRASLSLAALRLGPPPPHHTRPLRTLSVSRGTCARLSPWPSAHPQFVKVGYAGSNFPEHVFPSIVGRPILRVEERDAAVAEIKDIMVGDEAAALRNYLQITQPMEHGIVKDFDDMRHGE